MNTIRLLAVTAAVLLTIPTTSHGQDKPRKGFLAVLKEGQTVMLKENAGKFEITLMKNFPVGHKIIEVGADYVVVEDAAGVSETRIPVTSIKAIVKLKIPKE